MSKTNFVPKIDALWKNVNLLLCTTSRSCFYEKNHPTQLRRLTERDLGRMVYFTLQKQIVYMRIDSPH